MMSNAEPNIPGVGFRVALPNLPVDLLNPGLASSQKGPLYK
jgi:hypothetical protein